MKKLIPMALNEIHNSTLEILLFIEKVCREQNIQYFGLFGTVIGAVRHKGFIPWDDDLDIGMKRDDYNKFIEYFETHDTTPFYLDYPMANPKYPFYIVRVCDKRYCLKFDNYNYESGLFVDVYPFDAMGNDEDINWWKTIDKRKMHLYRKCLTASCYRSIFGHGKSPINRLLNVPLIVYSKLLGNLYFFKKIDLLSKKFNWENSKYVGCPTWNEKLTIYNKSLFSDVKYVDFETVKLPIPIGYDCLLKQLYGDYMKAPPLVKQKPQHGYKAYKKVL